jgi:hypothetical protein
LLWLTSRGSWLCAVRANRLHTVQQTPTTSHSPFLMCTCSCLHKLVCPTCFSPTLPIASSLDECSVSLPKWAFRPFFSYCSTQISRQLVGTTLCTECDYKIDIRLLKGGQTGMGLSFRQPCACSHPQMSASMGGGTFLWPVQSVADRSMILGASSFGPFLCNLNGSG